jgi:hypothetical protein
MSTISHIDLLLIFIFMGGFLLAMFDEEIKYRLAGFVFMVGAWL